MKIVHACAGWQANNGAAVIARLIAGEQKERGDQIFLRTWAGIGMLRAADEGYCTREGDKGDRIYAEKC